MNSLFIIILKVVIMSFMNMIMRAMNISFVAMQVVQDI